jgi:gas vesicle protein
MNRTEIINLIIGLGLFVGGILGIAAIMRTADRLANLSATRTREETMQDVWDDLTEMAFYQNASADDQIRFYDAFWKTNEKE